MKIASSSEFEEITKLLIGILAGCAIGFVFGWAWRQRSGVLADVSILDAMTAIGTVGAASIAAYGYWRSAQRDRKFIENNAFGALLCVMPDVFLLKGQLGHFKPQLGKEPPLVQLKIHFKLEVLNKFLASNFTETQYISVLGWSLKYFEQYVEARSLAVTLKGNLDRYLYFRDLFSDGNHEQLSDSDIENSLFEELWSADSCLKKLEGSLGILTDEYTSLCLRLGRHTVSTPRVFDRR